MIDLVGLKPQLGLWT